MIGHQVLHAPVDTQILTDVEQQLKTKHIVAVVLEQRRPRQWCGCRHFEIERGKDRCQRSAVETSERHASGGMKHRKYGFVTVGHHRRYEYAAPIRLDKRPALIRRPGAFFEIEFALV